MWEYWRHRLSRAKSEELERNPGMPVLPPAATLGAVAEETVVPAAAEPSAHGGDAAAAAAAAADAVDYRPSAAHVYFKDLKMLDADGEEEEDDAADDADAAAARARSPPPPRAPADGPPSPAYVEGAASPSGALSPRAPGRRVQRQRLVIVLVGLPARGKTFLCNKLLRYFNWLGHPTRHFNVGQYRRAAAAAAAATAAASPSSSAAFQSAAFFDPANAEGRAAREAAMEAALADMEAWLAGDEAQVAIFDATNSTHARRDLIRRRLHGRVQYMYLESVCTDAATLERNYAQKVRASPDYRGMPPAAALADFRERIARYEAAYETIGDRTMHYVKLINMVTPAGGHMDVNRISGYLPGKMVFFLLSVCKASGRMRRVWLTRHGESEFNVQDRVGGNSPLSPRGAAYAQLLPAVLASRVPPAPGAPGRPAPVAVWTSTLERTVQTAARLPHPKVQWKALDEIQAGACDGLTYADIESRLPEQAAARAADKLRYRYPSGESYMDVVQRLEPVAVEAERDRGCVCVVAHQAVLRALYGYFQNRPLEEIPALDIPLHTLIELAPQADGTMAETRLTVDVDRALREAGWFAPGGGGAGGGGGEEADGGGDGGAGHSPFAAAAGGGGGSAMPGRRSADDGGGGGGLRVGLVARSLSMADLAAAAVVVVAAKDAPSPRDGAPPL